MTGFGRTGTAFAGDHWGLTPDILVGGKGLAGGYAPLGGVFSHRGVLDPIADAGLEVMFHTFGAHPGACAAAEVVLSIMSEEGLVAAAAQKGAFLKACLEDVLGDHPQVAEVRGAGLLLAVELVQDRETGEPFPESVSSPSPCSRRGSNAACITTPEARGRYAISFASGPL